MHSSRIAILALLAFAAATATAQGVLPTTGQVVAGTGDQVPGLPGTTYNNMDTPVMDLNGNLLFSTSLLGAVTTVDNRALLYGRTASDMVLVARSGDPEPTGTMPGVTLVRWISATTPAANTIGSAYRISPQGGILLWGAGLVGPGIVNAGTTLAGKNDSCLFWGPVGGQSILVRRGDFTPGGGGSQIDSAYSSGPGGQASNMNASGTAVFQATLVGGDVVASPSNSAAWLTGVPGNLQIMLRKGDAYPIAGGNALIGSLGFNVQINEAGQVFHDEKFSTTLGTAVPLPTSANDGLLMLYTPGSGNQIVAREGDAAPGTAGANYVTFSMATIGLTRTSKMAFYADLAGGDVVGTTNNGAIYTGTAAGFTMAVRKGDPAPGGAGNTFSSFYTSSINLVDNGTLLFYGILAGPSVTTANDQCLISGTPGNWTILAREGDPAPGVVGGTLGPVQPGSAHLNDRGQAIFGCDLVIAATSQGATWAYDPNQGLVLLSTANDVYTTASGTLTANGVDGGIQFNSGDGCPMTLNNNGDFVRRISTGNGVGCAVRGMLGGLRASPASVSANGGTQNWELNAGAANAGRLYVIAGTLSGTRPGFDFGGSNIPLNQDAWFSLSLQAANGAVYTSSWGLLDANGHATASFNFPAGFNYFLGATFHHAFVALDLSTVQPTFVSQPASVRLY